MKIRIKKRVKAFTLLETAITLIIFVSLLMLSVVQLNSYQEQLILNNTTREIKSSIEQAARVSTIKHEALVINYFSNINCLNFKSKNYSRNLYLDKGVKVQNLTTLKLSSNGIMAPKTIIVSNSKRQEKIRLQMMWGRAVDE